MGVSARSLEKANVDRRYWEPIIPNVTDGEFTETVQEMANSDSYYEQFFDDGGTMVVTSGSNASPNILGIYLLKGAINKGYQGYSVDADRIIQCKFRQWDPDHARSPGKELSVIKNRDFLLVKGANTNKTDPIESVLIRRWEKVNPSIVVYSDSQEKFRNEYEQFMGTAGDFTNFIRVPDNWRFSK